MLDDMKIHAKIKLAALWTSVMFCYIYADYFGLFLPGQLSAMNRGLIPPLGRSTDGVMIFVSMMMAVPSLMIFLSVALPARPNRILNIIAGAAYTAIISTTMWSGAHFIFLWGDRNRPDDAGRLLRLEVAERHRTGSGTQVAFLGICRAATG